MSIISILIKGFSGLGVASTVPLSFAFHNETISFKSWERTAPPEAVKPVQEPKSQMEEMAQLAQQELGEKSHQVEIGCFATTGQHTPLWKETLYVCIDLSADQPESFWFYYSWRTKSNISRGAHLVKKITTKNSRQSTMYLKNQTGEKTVDVADKLRKWAGKEFNPKSNCQINKSQDTYTFTCGTGDKPFKQEVHRNDFYKTQTLSLS